MSEKEDDFNKFKEMSHRTKKGNVMIEKNVIFVSIFITDTCSGCHGVET
jgi:hypothetical protein